MILEKRIIYLRKHTTCLTEYCSKVCESIAQRGAFHMTSDLKNAIKQEYKEKVGELVKKITHHTINHVGKIKIEELAFMTRYTRTSIISTHIILPKLYEFMLKHEEFFDNFFKLDNYALLTFQKDERISVLPTHTSKIKL